MANAEEGFSPTAVEEFLRDNGGRATNVQVVRHFTKYLNDPEFKVLNRQKFKDFINEVATVKSEKGEKVLVLRNEILYREWIEPKHVIIRSAAPQATKPSWPPPAPEGATDTEPAPVPPARRRRRSRDKEAADQDGGDSSGSGRNSFRKSKNGGSPRPTISAPIYTGPVGQESVLTKVPGEKVVEDLSQIEGVRDARDKFELESRLQSPPSSGPAPRVTAHAATAPDIITPESDAAHVHEPEASLELGPSSDTLPPPPCQIHVQGTEEQEHEDEVAMGNGGVNGLQEDLEMETTPTMEQTATAPIPAPTPPTPITHISIADAQKALSNGTSRHHHDDDDHVGAALRESVSSDTLRSVKSTGSGNSYPDSFKLEPLERQWMLESAKGNIPALIGLADQEPALVGKRDFITGFSALHWGAKHGKKEMIRLVLDRDKEVDVNMRSQGGYTPLHVAAMHNKEAIMQFLVSECNANINRRDFSGRKPHHYLQMGASNYIKQILHGQCTADVVQPHSLMSLAEPKHEEKHRHSKLGSILRHSFRHSFRLWASAENLEDEGHKRDRTPPITPPPSPKEDRKSGHHSVNYSQSLLMPPPSGLPIPGRSRKFRNSGDKNRSDQHLRKSESNPDLLSDSPSVTLV